MVDGSLGEALGDAEVIGALAPSGRAVSLSAAIATASAADVDEIDVARGREYALLSALLARAPDQSLLKRLADLSGDSTPLGVAHAALAQAARQTSAAQVEREYFDLFIGLGRGELLPYGSYYLSGFLHERPLARLRAHLARLGIERAQGQAEPEDHAAILCEVMAGLANSALPAAAGAGREGFEQHLTPWVGRFFAALERAEAADFYRPVGALGRTWTEIETAALPVAEEPDGARRKESRPAAWRRSARCRSARCARPRPGRRHRPALRSRSARTSARTARSGAPSRRRSRTGCGSARSRAGTARSIAAPIAPRARRCASSSMATAPSKTR